MIGLLAVPTIGSPTASQAADLPYKAPPPSLTALPWNGLYAGVQTGYFWGTSGGVLTDSAGNNPFPWNVGPNNGLAGFHAGYDRRYGSFVIGVEADLEPAHQKGAVTLPTGTFRFGPAFPTTTFDSELNWLASVRGRAGVTFGKTLVYGTGGFAMGDVVTHYFPGGFPLPFGTATGVRPGWTAGGGVEYAFAPEWTARAEYRYTELDTARFTSSPFNAADFNTFNLHAVRVGASWRPGSAAAPAASASLFTALPAKDWTGFYVGAHVGGVQNRTGGNLFGEPEQTFGAFAPTATASLNASGFLGGVHGGFNYQAGQFVVGFEQDFSLTQLNRSTALASSISGIPAAVTESWALDWLASSRARIGFAPAPQWLIYGTGGIAYGRASATTSVAFPAVSYAGIRFDTRVGWIAGLGVEYALNDRWSVRAEYLHYDLGGMVVEGLPTPANPPFHTQAQFGFSGEVVRAGVDYKFGLPVTAGAVPPRLPTKAMPVKAIPVLADLDVAVGARYWYSSGKSQKDNFGGADVGGALVSRLTYDQLQTHSVETFVRADHRSGLFVKGFAGIGAMTSGKQNDEDFPPAIPVYSNVESTINNSKINYLSADVGYDFLRRAAYRLGVFAGYHYDHELMNEYGCRQTAAFGGLCAAGLVQSPNVLDITDDNHWHSVRLGLNGSVSVTDRLTLTGDAAWLPYTRLDATDTHWIRLANNAAGGGAGGTFSGPIPEEGVGHTGYQLEAMLDYRVTDAFSVGLGGRYWRMVTKGRSRFENVAAGGGAQPLNYSFERYGGFVQGSYKF